MSSHDSCEIIITDYATHANEIRAVRDQVFLVEQQIAPEDEVDDRDELCMHALALLRRRYHSTLDTDLQQRASSETMPIGTGRIDIEKDGKVGRLAVLKEFRRSGIGRKLMAAFEGYASEHKLPRLWFHAQQAAIPFYLELGYQIVSEEFEEAGILHVVMEKIIR